ncbi:MAG: hypothetical protein KF721_04860, partial [Ignavibacteriaceae bacterium]|nr:hypothetical protein [Ignavibacteriaceae bacterium]
MKNKFLFYLEDAEKLYVEDGLETIAIEGVLRKSVSRRTLDTWKDQYNWDKKRENHKAKRNNLQDGVLDMLNTALNQAAVEPSDKNFRKVETAVKLAQRLGIDLGIKVKGEENKKAAPAD